MIKRIGVLAVAVLMVLSAAAFAAPAPVKVAYNPATGNILGFIAIEKGIDKEEGVAMELVPFRTRPTRSARSRRARSTSPYRSAPPRR